MYAKTFSKRTGGRFRIMMLCWLRQHAKGIQEQEDVSGLTTTRCAARLGPW
jgi:hypothetical protein